jgi:hypothetical protein
MSVGVNSGLQHAPLWTPHRIKVTAADAAPPSATIKKAHGMVAAPYEDIFADVSIDTPGTCSIDVELLIWSDRQQRFLPFSTPVKFTALAGSKMLKFNVGGARFFLHVSGTFDTTTKVYINCAGLNPVQVESA